MNEYQVQVTITDTIITLPVRADSPEKALEYGREKLKKLNIFNNLVDVIDINEEVTGVY